MQTQQKPSFRASGFPKRKSVDLGASSLVETGFFDSRSLPLIVRPLIDGIDLIAWANGNRAFLESNLHKYGAILFRGFGNTGVEDFERFIRAASGPLLDYTYRSTPRKRVGGRVFTSTEFPPEMSIFLHNENSYSRNWPMKLFFLCVREPLSRGETPIANSRRMFERIEPDIRAEFISKNVMYVRNYGADIDLPWQDVFQTESRLEVEDYCRRSNIAFEWLGHGRLRTRQICQAVATHPKTGQIVWFNQANLFHVSSLPTEIRHSLLSNFDEESLPRNVYFGTGQRIDPDVIAHINRVYEMESVNFSWRKGDILMVDNMLTAHGRNPFTGDRMVVVGMAEPYSNEHVGLD